MSKRSFRSIRPVKLLAGMTSVLTVMLVSCTATPNEETARIQSTALDEESVREAGAIQVVTTILPITQFTKAVAGDRATVTQLLPTTADPHDFQAKPGDVQAIATADVLVQNGLELEFFLDDLIENAENSELVLIDSSEGIKTIALEKEHSEKEHSDDDHDEHGHDEHAHDEHNHDDHAHEEEKEHSDDDHAHAHHGSEDPHIWLDPKRAIEQVENIRDGLIAADPAGEAVYTDNAADYISQLQDLDAEIREQLTPYSGQTFISFHDFAAYFAESYGLNSEFLVDVPEANPSPEDMRRITETVEAENVKALLTEPSAGDSGFAALSKDLDIPVGVFDPVVIAGAAATEDADYYLSTMMKNVENLESALQ